jgi:hypothetical protein
MQGKWELFIVCSSIFLRQFDFVVFEMDYCSRLIGNIISWSSFIVCWFYFNNRWRKLLNNVQWRMYFLKLPISLPSSRTWFYKTKVVDVLQFIMNEFVEKMLRNKSYKIFFVMWLWSLWCVKPFPILQKTFFSSV